MRLVACAAIAFALVAAGCRQSDPNYPPACSNGPAALRTALARAPGEVMIEDVRVSECLVASSEVGPLQSFGGSVVDVAADLVPRTKEGDARAAVQLGFLRGALERGADSGVHEELLRRFEQELIGVDVRAPAFRRGQAAGLDHG